MPQLTRVLAAASILAVAGHALAQNSVVREGTGDRRTQLDKMELKPFPVDAFSKLSDWKNGRELSKGDIDGNVVLILTYADWYPQAKRAFSLAKKLSEQHAGKGLIVVAAHHAEGWDGAPRPEAGKDAKFLLAHDASNAFRSQLMVDQDPDFYLIDRAGQLRFADVTTESIESAVTQLLAEKADTAAGLTDRLAAEKARRDAEARRSEALRGQVDLTNLPDIPFEKPTKEEYEAVKWPPLPRSENQNTYGVVEEIVPPTISFGEDGWYPAKPNLEGKLILMYFWHPVIRNTFFEIMPAADVLQRQYGRDIVVVGVLTPFDQVNNLELTEEQKDPEKLKTKMEEFARPRNLDHVLYLDGSGALLDAALSTSESRGEIIIPFLALASSDMTLRWWPAGDSISPARALRDILDIDPGIKARRAAEQEYIRNRNK